MGLFFYHCTEYYQIKEEAALQYYLSEKEAVLTEIKSSDHGLTKEEAASRLEKNGPNKLKEAKK